MNKIKEFFKKIVKGIDYKDVIIFLIPFVMCLVYLIILYPGVLSYDSYNQLTQIQTMIFTSSHPFFHTFTEMMLMKIVDTPAIVALFQILFFCILWVRICKYNRNKYESLSFGYQILLTFIICLNPINRLMSITLWKDVLYSYVVLWFSFEMEKLIDNKFKVTFKDVIKYAFLLLLMPNLRHNGYIITLTMSIILIIIFIVKDRKKVKNKVNSKREFNYLKLIGFMLVFFLSFKGLERLYKVDEGLSVKEIGSIFDYKILAVAGEIGRYGKYTDEDAKALERYIDFDCMVTHSRYNSLDGMWVYCGGNPTQMKKHRLDMYKTVFSMVMRNKKVSIWYYLKEWGFVWNIVRFKDSWGNINYYGLESDAFPNFDYDRPFENTIFYEILSKYMVFTKKNRVFQTIFYSGSLCLYLSIILLVYLKKAKKKNYLLVFIPTFVNVIGIGLTASVNDVRYYYSNFLVLYLIGAIFIKYWLDYDKQKN